MNMESLRSSRSSYGDPRYLSSGYPNGAVSLPSRVLVDGYRSASDLATDDRSQYSGVSINHSGANTRTNGPSIDVSDSVLMHLLTETAIGDSAGYEILPFEEVEELKREYTGLSNRIEGTKRKLALETKLRDAAQSLRRLPGSNSNGSNGYTNGVTNGTNGITNTHEDEELAVSSRKCDELAQELWGLERRAQEIHKRLLEHTAGILQLTHRGLKKNLNRSSTNQGPNGTTFDFDDRSLYKPLETDDSTLDVSSLRSAERKLEELNGRFRDILLAGRDAHDAKPLPLRVGQDTSLAYIQNHLAYLEDSLKTLQAEGYRGGESGISSSEVGSELSAINNQLQNLLGQAGSHLSPTLPPPPSPSGEYLNPHMDYLKSGMEDLQGRIARLQEQKGILTTQIQQQRELNSKSDAEKDAHVADLAQQLVEAKKQFELSEREVQTVRDEMALVMEQLDSVKQQENLQDQHKDNEVQRLRNELTHIEGEFARVQTELTVVKAELDGAYGTRAERAAEAAASPALYKEIEDLNTKNISLTEELAALRAEQVNGGGGGNLQKRVETLQKELEDTVEDYESMTKASIEFEKEREKYEGTIDNLRDRCEQLETQLSDERITWMGMNNQMTSRDGATETTSTMVLKNEFKKMMRDTRAENLKLLRAEQEERKKLEALVRSLKMEQTMGKPNLNQT